MIKVTAIVGIGTWKVQKTVSLVACPHVGDMIDVEGITVTCETVSIGEDVVYVSETVRFSDAEALKEYINEGWKR